MRRAQRRPGQVEPRVATPAERRLDEQVWRLNALRMTVVPLIFAVLVTGIAQVSDAAATGRLALRAVAWFLVLLIVSAVTGVLLVNGLYALWPVSETAAAALRAGAQAPAGGGATAPDFVAWVKSLAPANPIKKTTQRRK